MADVPTLTEFMLGPQLWINLICARCVRFAHAVENRPEHELLGMAKPIVCVIELAPQGSAQWWIFEGAGRTPDEAFADAWARAAGTLPDPSAVATSSLIEEFLPNGEPRG